MMRAASYAALIGGVPIPPRQALPRTCSAAHCSLHCRGLCRAWSGAQPNLLKNTRYDLIQSNKASPVVSLTAHVSEHDGETDTWLSNRGAIEVQGNCTR